jgi:hypothetical protein
LLLLADMTEAEFNASVTDPATGQVIPEGFLGPEVNVR